MRLIALLAIASLALNAQITPIPGGSGSGSGTVNNGTAGNLGYYSGTGTAISELTTAVGMTSFITTPSSANLRTLLTDESGTGALFFAGGNAGTPSALVGTNITGSAAAFTAGLATALETARTICGVSFNGTGNISLASTCLTDTANLVRNNAANTFSTGAQVFTGATLRVPNSTTLPANCTVGDVYMDTNATSGARWYLCESTDTWGVQGSGSGSGVQDVLAGTGTSVANCTPGSTTCTVNNVAPVFLAIDAGGDDTYVPTSCPGIPAAYSTGQMFSLKVATANTGAATLDCAPGGGASAKAIKLANGTSDPANGDIVVGVANILIYDETANAAAGAFIVKPAASGGGITSIEGQTGATQTFTDDTNVTIASAADAHVLGWTGQLSVNRGGTGLASGTSGGILGYTASGTLASSAALTAGAVLVGGGAGVVPTEIASTSVPNAGQLRFGATPASSATQCVLTAGTAVIAVGSANGNELCVNAPSGFTGFLLDLELNGAARFSVNSAGNGIFAGNVTGVNGVFSGPVSGTTGTFTGLVSAGASSNYNWAGRSRMLSPSDGVIELLNNGSSDFTRLQFGGTSSSFPSLKRSTTALQVRLADDSGAGNFYANAIIGDGTTPTVSSGTIGTGSRNIAGFITSATTGVYTGALTFNGVTAPVGWACASNNLTTGTATFQTAYTTTTATISGTTTTGDVIIYKCSAF